MAVEPSPQRNRCASTLRTVQSFVRLALGVLVTMLVCLLAFIIVAGGLQWAHKTHWLLGAIATLLFAAVVLMGLHDLRGPWSKSVPLHRGAGLVLITAMTAILVAGSASFLLLQAGWARYEPAPSIERAHMLLTAYYAWLLVDLLPGLDATRLLSLEPPLRPMNLVAGLPAVLFRVFVVLGLVVAVRAWWKSRDQAPSAA